jgi:hypothetical protein
MLNNFLQTPEQRLATAQAWSAIRKLADELANRRGITLRLPPSEREDDIRDSFDRFLP